MDPEDIHKNLNPDLNGKTVPGPSSQGAQSAGSGSPGPGNPIPQVPLHKSKEKGGAARQTLYRVTVRNQLRSIAIADGKANILIGINTILISLIITVLGVGSSFAGLSFLAELDLNLPLTIFLIACFGSASLAILAVRPSYRPWKDGSPGKLFFRDVRESSLEEYQEFIGEVLKSGASVYETLNTDMWLFSKTVIRKYNMLRFAYTVFLVGLAALVISFLLIRLIK